MAVASLATVVHPLSESLSNHDTQSHELEELAVGARQGARVLAGVKRLLWRSRSGSRARRPGLAW